MIYQVGQNLNREYRVVNVLEGGMALVYIIENPDTGKRLAAKTVREEFLNDPLMVARFRREMKIWRGIGSHPNVVRAFSITDIGSAPFSFMEYLEGGSVLSVLRKTGTLTIDRTLRIAEGVAEGMNHVHNCITADGLRGIIHRDLTPSNIMMSGGGDPKIADFGLARALDMTLLTRTCDVLGTLPYLSPEQLLDSRAV
ncbi:MAG: serine/threonine protein kinase, partial [Candidatus Lindowbacteria bacterium]|nr:serine/threonine protein kinase [Candidatus Lindowbacteria bacterium]